MTEYASVHRLQIARDLTTDANGATATFCYGDTHDVLCAAWFVRPDFRKIRVSPDWTSPERASAVSIAIQMALEWISEQS